MSYRLHYAPDNASLIVRLCLDHAGIAHETVLVDRASRAQDSAGYRALNPNGLIPVLETPTGPLFETGAICLWLADTHSGLGPAPTEPARADYLKWLFFVANTLHPSLRMLFYPEKYLPTPAAIPDLRLGLQAHIATSLKRLETAADQSAGFGGAEPTALDFYIAACLRWSALYPKDSDRAWFTRLNIPQLKAICKRIEALPACARLQAAEGLGETPFSAPRYATPPEGSAT